MTPTVRPYGSWPTPVTSDVVVQAAVTLHEVAIDDGDVFWLEMRPSEGGRNQIVRWRRDSGPVDVLPAGANARTAAHEYGGGAWWLDGGRGWFTDWSDQRIYEFDPRAAGDASVRAVSVEPSVSRGDRWADGELEPSGRWLIVVREHHPTADGIVDVANELVAVDTEGAGEPIRLVSGVDFVSDPRVSPDGRLLSWLQWHHPDMPWDGTELCVAPLRVDDAGPTLGEASIVAGRASRDGDAESVFQPRWAADGTLWFVSDRTGWWNLYRASGAGTADSRVETMVSADGEIGVPQWTFRQSRYGHLDGDRVVFACQRSGLDRLAVRDAAGAVVELDLPYVSISSLQAAGDAAVFVGATTATEPAIVRLTLDGTSIATHELLSDPRRLGIDERWFATAQPITFPTASSDGRGRDEVAHALYYSPTNPDSAGPEGTAPPLLVLIHGGPTSAARPHLSLGVQYWTSRGFAVVDVNYRGSSGFGRAYRDRLKRSWGVVDLDDCEGAARYLVDQGLADGDRLCIMGGSAGGYTTLAALATRDTFAAGANLFGIADLEVFATETHKFESRYLDSLFGPYPEARETYIDRSPIRHLNGFDRPLIVFQGLEDEVVPPNQSEMIVDALRDRGVPVAYVPFAGEQHGFRQAANIRRTLDGTLSFFAQVFRFALPRDEAIEPVAIENAGALAQPPP
jgi:dipeptidyl aminopeptidase/acylaminoacyl peptidase